VRWLGEGRDPVEAQLADIARQGARMAHVAHVCAAALLILFSAASFVALGGDTFAEIQTRWTTGHEVNVAAAISLSVITLMVLAFDVGMLYAASMLRLLATRRAGLGEQWLHVLVMVSVAAIEAATYCYMAWRYEHPATALAWALIAVRAAAAPLLAVYLSMARPLPVTARDILAQAELASGAGVIRDVVREAQDASAPLADKIALYGASAVMATPDRARLAGMLEVVQRRQYALARGPIVQLSPQEGPLALPAALQEGSHALQLPGTHVGAFGTQAAASAAASREDTPPDRPPTGPGNPVALPVPAAAVESADDLPVRRTSSKSAATLRLVDAAEEEGSVAPRRRRRQGTNGRRVRTASVEAKARAAWRPGMTVGQLERAAGISRSMAGKYRRVLLAEEGERAAVAQ
jgi:hypothetical protein